MTDYRKPSKMQRDAAFAKGMGLVKVSPYFEASIEPNKLFLIICEGENTEPEYFKSFPVPSKTVLVEGGCHSKTKLVDYALTLKSHPENEGREIWCIFDMDIQHAEVATQPKDFNNAISKAQQNGLKVAWSNDSFELWFLLHFQTLNTALERSQINKILKGKWGLKSFHKEAKTQEFCAGHYNRHGGSKSATQSLAIARARELHESYRNRSDYHKHCPCTTVYLLVTELNKYLKK